MMLLRVKRKKKQCLKIEILQGHESMGEKDRDRDKIRQRFNNLNLVVSTISPPTLFNLLFIYSSLPHPV
jgi:hypothetical protein